MSVSTSSDLNPIMTTNDYPQASSATALDPFTTRRTPKMPENEKEVGQPNDPISITSATSRAYQTSQTVAKLLKGEEKEWTAVAEKKGPLHLLDLPVVILKEIVKEVRQFLIKTGRMTHETPQVTHTNDLTSLALTHSALHELAIPHIYSRFDIVWPDSQAVSDVRNGVDALTYGLATLVMAQDVFGEAPNQQLPSHPYHKCSRCGHLDRCQHTRTPQSRRKIRRGNHFAQFTRKFSLGNGPADWVQEYLITKEGGKMLGTLVALAIGRMRNLEQFVWDMPTGVLRDVWAALASLGDRDDGQTCHLEKIWVRWHNNSDPEGAPPSANLAAMNPTLLSAVSPGGHPQSFFHIPQYPRVEFPTFSNLSPLKSLTVLDIDELSYVEEMSLLLERSRGKLRELRIGVAHHAQERLWAIIPDEKIDTSRPNSEHRPSGVLGVLLAKVIQRIDFETTSNQDYDIPELQPALEDQDIIDSPCPPEKGAATHSNQPGEIQAAFRMSMASLPFFSDETTAPKLQISDKDVQTIASALAQSTIDNASQKELPQGQPIAGDVTADELDGTTTPMATEKDPKYVVDERHGERRSSIPTECEKRYARDLLKLQLEVLALERVPLSVPVLSKSIDWTTLSSLTILHCDHHEQLWKSLRKRFTPKSSFYGSMSARSSKSSPYSYSKHYSSSRLSIPMEEYPLKLKRLQTDAVSSQLIAFIKEALAPDSLEWLFLQEGRPYRSNVSVENIYKGAIRRHRGSLKKLLIDSEDRNEEGQPVANHHWRRWILNREVLTFITSGKMPNLRELGMSIEYKDWVSHHRYPQSIQH